ncbi:MAG: DUF2917 domain-containing protein [Pseudomonadota bacterium]|jgi:Protein of unknown function (DUF2917)|uniref:DUF2917 domain-containing protein n=1 Tax=Caballeronia sordidicola TaxID=196367 RepID=A0A242MWG5_CABSO|nr:MULTISPECIES: DUF2917 domain-containing protein [Burkholderiaceae]MDP9156485.1 DUF2917 domain-containing protein [Pseudomonadota bacterium]AME23623.1 hypothetical protein AXG89_06975 [Burkholderia sp. PAMC 26561]AMM12803.1 hypothetical protein AX768_00400 [Burkholderia sp. PAMC 28687]OTP65829.1 hypothetical protein PAMC26510_36975 [Caballeronia sordidicola]OTP75777.1 hypothetical protein PAMC26577_12475 [Caballeronia sordidicola]
MREISTSITFEIADGETVPMRIGNSVKLSVLGAPVWATRSNDTEDYWLVPGDSLKLRQHERLWLSTEAGGTAQVVFTLARRPDQRAIGWLARGFDRLAERFRSGWRTV